MLARMRACLPSPHRPTLGMRSCEGCLVKGPAHRLDVSFSTRGGTAFRGRPHGVIGPRLALLPPNLAVAADAIRC